MIDLSAYNHTPGLWSVYRTDEAAHVCGPDGDVLAYCTGPLAHSDAILMASAPFLLHLIDQLLSLNRNSKLDYNLVVTDMQDATIDLMLGKFPRPKRR